MSRAKSTAASLISRGLSAVVLGVVSSAWPGVTVRAFATCALIAAGIEIVRASTVTTAAR
jgi:hypothetical protein